MNSAWVAARAQPGAEIHRRPAGQLHLPGYDQRRDDGQRQRRRARRARSTRSPRPCRSASCFPDEPNALRIQRDPGDGRLYYRAFLDVSRPAGDAPALSRGVFIQREYFTGGQDCKAQDCTPVKEAELGSLDGLLVRLTVTVPKDMYYVVVEDTIPAGTEMIDPNLKTSRQGFVKQDQPESPLYDPMDPFRGGWGWWRFGQARSSTITCVGSPRTCRRALTRSPTASRPSWLENSRSSRPTPSSIISRMSKAAAREIY